MSRDEILHVLEGSLEVDADDEHFVADVGDAVLVPAQARLCVSNCTDRPARAWVATTVGMTATMEGDGQHIAPPWAQ